MDGGMEGWRDGGMEGWRDGGMEGWRKERVGCRADSSVFCRVWTQMSAAWITPTKKLVRAKISVAHTASNPQKTLHAILDFYFLRVPYY
jgi:hypothetical protein